MAININNLQGNQSNQINSSKNAGKLQTTDGKAASNVAAQAKPPVPSDPVSLTDEAKQLGSIQKRLIDAPADNSEKIATLKQAVIGGSYKVDNQSLALKMGSFESQLNNKLFG